MSLMLQEIAEQPAALERTIAEERAKIAKLGNLLKARDIHLIVLVARGSSDNAALFGRYLLEITTGIPVSLSAPSVHTIYNAKLRLDHALVVGVSQSGEGEDINRVLENARQSGAYTIGITNEPGSSMTQTRRRDTADTRRTRALRSSDQNIHRPDAPLLYARGRAGPEPCAVFV